MPDETKKLETMIEIWTIVQWKKPQLVTIVNLTFLIMTNQAESYFSKIANDILEAADQIVTRFDEGLNVILSGKLPEGGGVTPGTTSENVLGPDNDLFMDMDEDMHGSPLEGMADSVLKDIIKGQAVSSL